MRASTADVVICGAGICGLSAAYHLAVKQGIRKVVLVDERQPMSFTSDKSTECYRNWWPGPGDTMVQFMNRSIDLLEELAASSQNYFHMNRRGYVFLTGRPERAREYETIAREITTLGAGPLRLHSGASDDPPFTASPADGYRDSPAGADLVLDPALIRQTFPFVTEKAIAMLHPRRCGWMSAQQLGMYLLEQARQKGAELVCGRLGAVTIKGGRIQDVRLETSHGWERIHTDHFAIASGPFLKQTGNLIGIDLPVYNELHAKLAFKDPLGVIPRHVPLMIWDDPVRLVWTEEEKKELASDEQTRWLLGQFPAGVHFRPEGGPTSPIVLAIWTYDVREQEPVPQPRFESEYADVILRGLVHMVPGLRVYLGRIYDPIVDGGYYCKTRENRPLIGPLPVEGAYVFGAVSGFGIMGGMAGGELLALHVAGKQLPAYAGAFQLNRYEDPVYQDLLAQWSATSGQL